MKLGFLFRSTATLAIAALVVGCASGGTTTVLSLAEGPVEHDVDVVLTIKPNKQCGVPTDGVKPPSVPPRRSRRDKVKWHIHNGCGMKLDQVKIVFDNNDTHPFEDSCKKWIDGLGANSTGTLKCTVERNAKDGQYKYWIHINGVAAVEPDIEVWP